MTEEEQMEELRQRYQRAAHAMQSGVAYSMTEENCKEIQPKQLRVSINSAMCDHAAIVKLLMDKGIITELEYLEAITVQMEAEVKRYEMFLSTKMGSTITLM